MGVWCCINCPWKMRPSATPRDLPKQYEKRCSLCDGKLMYLTCEAKAITVISPSTFTYTHQGKHYHPQPPGGKLLPQQYEQAAFLIQHNPNALPQQLRVGTSIAIPGSLSAGQSIGHIAPQLNNLSTISQLRKKVLSETPGLITSIRGSDTFILDYQDFQQSCPNFVQHFDLDSNNTAIISVQTEFMRQTLSIFSNTIQLSNTETTVECDNNFDLNNDDDIVIEVLFPKVFKY